VVGGVGAAVAAAGAAEGARAAAAGVRRRPVCTLTGAAGLLLPLPLSGLLLGAAAGLLGITLAGPVGGLLAGVGAEAALSSGVVGLGELAAAVLAVPPDDPHGIPPA
jgi:hypothetical protein